MDDTVVFVYHNARRRQRFDRAPVGDGVIERSARCYRRSQQRSVLAHPDWAEQPGQQSRFVPWLQCRLEDPGIAIEAAEKPGRVIGAFRWSQHHVTAGVQRIVEGAADLFLQFPVKIDQDIAARNQVHAREWWVFQKIVMRGKNDDWKLLTYT